MFVEAQCLSEDGGIYEFQKKFFSGKDSVIHIKIYAQQRYLLYVNGTFVSEGPCRSAESVRYIDRISVNIPEGENEILVKVLHIRESGRFTTVFKSEYPGFYLEAVSEEGIKIESDLSWSCKMDRAHHLLYKKGQFHTTAPCEEILGERDETLVALWENVKMRVVVAGGHDYGGYGLFELKDRPIPFIPYHAPESFKVVRKGENFVELDAGRYVTAKPHFIFHGRKGNCAEIIYAECYRFGEEKRDRCDSRGEIRGKSDIIHFSGDVQEFEPFWFRAYRFIRIETEELSALQEASFAICHYPLNITGSFACSDSYYNKMWDISVNTMLCCMHEIFVDCPYREQQQYIMDSAIEMMVSLRMSSDTRLIEKMIEEFASSRIPEGLLSANYPHEEKQIIPSFSLFYIMMVRDYLRYSGKTAFVRRLTPVVDGILSYFSGHADENRLYLTGKYWDFVDWVPDWGNYGMPVEGAGHMLTVMNLCYAYGLKCAAEVCQITGRYGLASEYEITYQKLKTRINALCFDPEKGLYRDEIGKDSYSEHTIVWAILAAVQPENVLKEMAASLGKEFLHKCTFSMKYYLFRALESIGEYDRAWVQLEEWKSMIDLHCTTWCETPNNPSSECHGWSSAPLYEFSANILGVKFMGNQQLLIQPHCGNLSFAKGTVPTPEGLIRISWKKENGVFTAAVEADFPMKGILELPDGQKITIEGKTTGGTADVGI